MTRAVQVLQSMKADERRGLTPIALRKRAAAFARETVDKQVGWVVVVWGDWACGGSKGFEGEMYGGGWLHGLEESARWQGGHGRVAMAGWPWQGGRGAMVWVTKS
jgi:hypothetical protein